MDFVDIMETSDMEALDDADSMDTMDAAARISSPEKTRSQTNSAMKRSIGPVERLDYVLIPVLSRPVSKPATERATSSTRVVIELDDVKMEDNVRISDAPMADSRLTDSPVADYSMADSPVVDSPVADSPVVDFPVVNSPVVDSPVADSSVADASGRDKTPAQRKEKTPIRQKDKTPVQEKEKTPIQQNTRSRKKDKTPVQEKESNSQIVVVEGRKTRSGRRMDAAPVLNSDPQPTGRQDKPKTTQRTPTPKKPTPKPNASPASKASPAIKPDAAGKKNVKVIRDWWLQYISASTEDDLMISVHGHMTEPKAMV